MAKKAASGIRAGLEDALAYSKAAREGATIASGKKRYPLPRRFAIALSAPAYARLRALNAEHGLGNNYLLTILLENLDEIASRPKLERAFRRFVAEYGAPAPAAMRNKS